jgi:hypothetical protein
LCCQVDRDDLDGPGTNGVPTQPLIRRVAGQGRCRSGGRCRVRDRRGDGPDGVGVFGVGVSGGGAPDELAGGRLLDLPAAVGFEQVLPVAERAGVVLRGGPVGVRDGVVDLAGPGRPVAADAAAGAVPRNHVVDQVLGWPVPGAAVVEDPPGGRVGEDPPPGPAGGEPAGDRGRDRPEPVQLPGRVGQPDQGRVRREHPDLDPPALRGGQPLSRAAAAEVSGVPGQPGHLRQRVGAASRSATHASGSNIHSSIETTAHNFVQTRSAIPARIASGAFLRRRLLAEVRQPTGSRARNTGSRLDCRGMARLRTYADRKSLWLWAGDAYTCRRPRPSRSRKGWVSWPSLSSACLRPPVLLPGLQPPDPAGPVGTRTWRVNPDPRDRGGQPLIRRVHSSLVFHD